jgi:hypothetical protein
VAANISFILLLLTANSPGVTFVASATGKESGRKEERKSKPKRERERERERGLGKPLTNMPRGGGRRDRLRKEKEEEKERGACQFSL